MGIPHLYTHLRRYAHPETFPQTGPHVQDGTSVPLFIDGPGLAHHVYQMALCSTPPTSASPWDCALSYSKFQTALIRYLDVLADAQLHIRKIYFDGHLPASKLSTRHSRLDDALRRLKHYHSLHAHSLRSASISAAAAAAAAAATTTAFTPAATYTPRTTPLSAPPFILAATIDALSSHPTYSCTVCTVPGEAESYCARDAMSTSGLVLTGDSDLLLFTAAAGDPPTDWGVVMFRDVTLTFPGVVAVVFRPLRIAATLGVDLTFLGYLVSGDPHATFTVLQQRVKRIEERKRRGVAVGEYGRAWREFRDVYELPGDAEVGTRGVEPRIAELLNAGAEATVFLPFVWEDPGRGSAWDAGRGVRAAAYALLGREGVSEVCRRGQRIADAFVHARDAEGVLRRVLDGAGEGEGEGEWWVRMIVEDVAGVYEERGQSLPEKSLLEGVAYMLSAVPRAASQKPAPTKWTWEKVQVFAMAQAAWYSLLVLKEVLTATGKGAACTGRFDSFPGVAECIDGSRFLQGATLAGEKEKNVVGNVVAEYHARVRSAADEDVDVVEDTGNGNGKRSSSREELRAGTKGERKKKKRNKEKKKKNQGGSSNGVADLDNGNIFTVLAD